MVTHSLAGTRLFNAAMDANPIGLIVIFALWFLLPTRSPSTSLTYSKFLDDVAAGQVKTVQISGSPGGTRRLSFRRFCLTGLAPGFQPF